jgi:hypothetical protein
MPKKKGYKLKTKKLPQLTGQAGKAQKQVKGRKAKLDKAMEKQGA